MRLSPFELDERRGCCSTSLVLSIRVTPGVMKVLDRRKVVVTLVAAEP